MGKLAPTSDLPYHCAIGTIDGAVDGGVQIGFHIVDDDFPSAAQSQVSDQYQVVALGQIDSVVEQVYALLPSGV